MKINHIRQTTSYSCGACSFAMIANVSEAKAIELCKTDKEGTYDYDVNDAFKGLGFETHFVTLNVDWSEHSWTFEKSKYPIYVSGFFKTRYNKRGRPREREHAFVISEGYVYDPAEDIRFPIEAFNHIFDTLTIENIIIVERKI
jgi:hypothetical protein